jgi:hypothetical protein
VTTLNIKGSLAKDSSNESSLFDIGLYLLKNIRFGLSWRTNQDDISIFNHALGIVRNECYFSFDISFVLPS